MIKSYVTRVTSSIMAYMNKKICYTYVSSHLCNEKLVEAPLLQCVEYIIMHWLYTYFSKTIKVSKITFIQKKYSGNKFFIMFRFLPFLFLLLVWDKTLFFQFYFLKTNNYKIVFIAFFQTNQMSNYTIFL